MKRFAQYVLIAFFAGFFFAGNFAHAATGFVTSPMWMSPDSPSEGDFVTLGTVFLNDDAYPLSGTVVFYDGDVLLAKKSITIQPNQVGTATATFIITAGDHSFSATMSSISEQGGTTETFDEPDETVRLPDKFIPAKVSLAGQASDQGADASEEPILDQINTAEQNVLNKVPAPTKNVIANAAGVVDAWRASKVPNLSAGVDSANAQIKFDASTKMIHATTVVGSAMISVSNAPNDFDSPFAYVKLFFYTVITYIFSTPLLFYALAILFVYFILRFIFRRIARSIRNGRISAKSSKSSPSKH